MYLSKRCVELYDITVLVVISKLHYTSNSNNTASVIPSAAMSSHASVNQYWHWAKRKSVTQMYFKYG
jgi:response regulator of citrate/malate metabolism